jgi:hypothetical protein
VVRSIFEKRDPTGHNKTHKATAAFFVLYFLVAGIILINVVIAVLLDEFIESISKEKEKLGEQRAAERETELAAVRIKGVMDPVLMNLSRFSFVSLHVSLRALIDVLMCPDMCPYSMGVLMHHEPFAGLRRKKTCSNRSGNCLIL